MKRFPFLGSFIRTVALAAIALMAVAAARAQRPNIVIFLADDLGWNDVGYHGSEIQTPHLDRLAREGVQLDRFYVYPVCSPTRAGLMTARSSMRTGMMYSVIRPWANYGLALDEHLMPETFRAAGYQTAATGKWHLGHERQRHLPRHRGFDHFYGHVNGAIDYFTHMREGAVDWQRNGKTVIEEGYTTDLLAQEAVRWIQSRDEGRPLFLYVPFNAPHTPLQAPEKLIAKYAHIADRRRRIFAAMVDALDAAIGRILGALEQESILENTIVLFFSDNGGPVQQGARNTPLRDGKGSTFEGGIRVPAILRWKAKLPGGGKSPQVMTNLDVFPTLAAAAGVTARSEKALDGKNLWDAIRRGQSSPREDLFFAMERRDELRLAVQQREWKLVRIIRNENRGVTNYLFRISEDPNEQNNLAEAHPEIVQELTQRIENWRGLHPAGGVRFSPGPHPGWIAPKDWAAAARP